MYKRQVRDVPLCLRVPAGERLQDVCCRVLCPPRVVETEVPFHTGVEDVDAMLADIQQKLDTLHSLNESLPDPQLRCV